METFYVLMIKNHLLMTKLFKSFASCLNLKAFFSALMSASRQSKVPRLSQSGFVCVLADGSWGNTGVFLVRNNQWSYFPLCAYYGPEVLCQ